MTEQISSRPTFIAQHRVTNIISLNLPWSLIGASLIFRYTPMSHFHLDAKNAPFSHSDTPVESNSVDGIQVFI